MVSSLQLYETVESPLGSVLTTATEPATLRAPSSNAEIGSFVHVLKNLSKQIDLPLPVRRTRDEVRNEVLLCYPATTQSSFPILDGEVVEVVF